MLLLCLGCFKIYEYTKREEADIYAAIAEITKVSKIVSG